MADDNTLRRKRNFILGQGFEDPPPETCAVKYSGLQFQPVCVTVWTVLGIAFQSSLLFLALGAALWWSALAPSLNPFERTYNATIGNRPGRLRLGESPGPRRFAMGMAGTFSLAIALFLLLEEFFAAYAVEAVLLLASCAMVLGGFCFGSFVYHLARGNLKFALATLPWKHGP